MPCACSSPRWRGLGAAIAIAAASAAVVGAPSAGADPTATTAPSDPRPATPRIERVLAVHDELRGEQHLVRELVFDGPPGFVDVLLATPSRPELIQIAESAGDPFRTLDQASGIEPAVEPAAQGFGGVRGPPERRRLATQPRKPVRTAMLSRLTPGDHGFYETELRAVGYEVTPATSRWLEQASVRGLHLTVLRFDMTKPSSGGRAKGMPSALVHLRFKSPMPFLPYEEPERDDPTGPRLTSVWLVSRSGKVPLALRESGSSAELVRPLREVGRHDFPDAGAPALALGEASWRNLVLEGAGPWVVQRFDDQKRDRRGYGDVVFVPKTHASLSDESWERQRELTRLLERGGSRR